MLGALAALSACSAGDTVVDPGDLELRDLLGLSPDAATRWTAEQRLAARRVLEAGLAADATHDAATAPDAATGPPADAAAGLDERIAALLATVDTARADDAAAPLGIVAIDLDGLDSASDSAPAATTTTLDRDRGPRARAAIASFPGPRAAAVLREQSVSFEARPPVRLLPSLTAPPSGVDALDARPLPPAEAPSSAGALPARVPSAIAVPSRVAAIHAQPLSSADVSSAATAPRVELWLAERWDTGQSWSQLPGPGAALLAALALDAGHRGGPVVVVPAPRLAVIAAYVRPGGGAPPRLSVNPVALAALERAAGDAAAGSATVRMAPPAAADRLLGPQPVTGAATVASTGGNPYSFYGSVAECAAAQRSRCDACLPTSSCRPITNIADGNAECTMLGDDAGRGYFLLCINLSLAITSIDRCTGDAAPACVRDPHAADSLATLENNADFLADPSCGDALDGCLARIFGPPDGSFPGLDAGLDAGTAAPPARSTSVACSNSCSNDKNVTCNASPSCDCSGPSCNNSLSCDSACSSSNDQGGCGGNCNACGSSGGGGGTGGGGCGGGSSSSGGGCSSNSSNSGCGNSCGSSNSSSNSGCGGGCSSGSGNSSCGGGGCSSGSNSSSCGGSSGGGKCTVATVDPAPGIGLAMSVLWATLPIALATFTRRRARRRAPLVHTPPTTAHVGALITEPAGEPTADPCGGLGTIRDGNYLQPAPCPAPSTRTINPPPTDHIAAHAHVGALITEPAGEPTADPCDGLGTGRDGNYLQAAPCPAPSTRTINPPPTDHIAAHAHAGAPDDAELVPAQEEEAP